MSFTSLLINVCTTQRFTAGIPDAYGLPTKTWNNFLIAEPCRLDTAGGREVQVGAEVVIADGLLFIGDVDITEQDRVVIGTVTYEVLLVERMQDSLASHHKECFVRTVR